MKLLLGTCVAIASTMRSVSALEACDATEFAKLATSPSLTQCLAQSKVPLPTLSKMPTIEQLEALCKTPTCVTAIGLILGVDPKDCIVPIGGQLKLRSELVDPTVAYCETMNIKVVPVFIESSASSEALAGNGSSAGSEATNSSSGGDVSAPDNSAGTPQATDDTSRGYSTIAMQLASVAVILTSLFM
ncbi:hypothetical protein Poli38472_011166 [Pythium oligandrum]|uniref:Elicitin n=1 Tax=Pythium oligandrum TaxID=41045 RepID=A0A8K1FLV2_PYTOL|nr:hypothetical protein Poli38472_011166 [Pythium oligandrum]|eukprot:TMW67546.1 hypothetical protein Poli38472_011166 [Pythium oligandrum]